jgi:trehalose 6-phosphate phosphatase
MNEPPFAGRRPVFVGDDPIDEDAFREVNRTNGYSVIVGGRADTAATHRLASVRAVHAWLRTFANRLIVGEPARAERLSTRRSLR